MDIRRKIEIAETAIRSISEHEDVDSLVRRAALTSLKVYVDEQIAEIEARAARAIADQVTRS